MYEMRVDWVHQEVLRMTSGLSRMQVAADRKRGQDGDENDDGAGDEPGGLDEDGLPANPKPKPKKKRQTRSTIVKNVDTINAPLETEPFIDPIFAQMKSYVGDVASTKRSFMYLLGSRNSELLLNSEQPFWEPDERPDMRPEDPAITDPVEIGDNRWDNMPKIEMDGALFEVRPVRLRTVLRGYTMTDKPMDIIAEVYGEDEENPNLDDFDDHFDNAENGIDEMRDLDDDGFINNTRSVPYAFDVNAEVDPICFDEPRNTMHLQSLANLDTYADDEIGEALRPVKPNELIVNSMVPNDGSRRNLEYSYRSLDNIHKYWAGPSFWKIVPPRIRKLTSDTKVTQRKRKQKTWEPPVFDTKDLNQLGIKEFDVNQVPKITMKTWDAKKLKLPTKYEIDETEFYYFGRAVLPFMGDESMINAENLSVGTNIQNTSIRSNTDGQQPPNEMMPPGGDDGENDNMMATDDHHDFDDGDLDGNTVGAVLPLDAGTSGTGMDKSISMHFEGAPEKLERIVLLPYAKHAKLVDMKQLKLSCLRSFNLVKEKSCTDHRILDDRDKAYLKKVTKHLRDSNENYMVGFATFQEVVQGLPKLLSKKQENNLSTALAFSAALHLANDQGLRFIPVSDVSSTDFKIVKIIIDRLNAD